MVLSVNVGFATAIASGLVLVWVVNRTIVYRRAVKLIPIPGYRGLGPRLSSLYGLLHVKLMQHIEDNHIYSTQHQDYERFGWDIISSIYWFASKPRFFIADASIIQHIGASRTLFTKPGALFDVFNMFGKHVLTAEGAEWVRHRKLTSRAFTEPNMQMVWNQSTRIVNEMFDSDWAHQGDVVAIDDIINSTTQLTMLVLMAVGFEQDDQWINTKEPPPGHVLTFRQALYHVVHGLLWRISLPQWVWGSQASRDTLAVAGIAGRGWLGKQAQHTAIAFSELAEYLRELLRDELANAPDEQGRGTLFKSLVEALVSQNEEIPHSKNDLFGNMFIFLVAGYETTAHALAYTLGLLALDDLEQQRLYDHIEDVLQDRESAFEDVPKLNRVLAVFFEALRLYPAGSEQTRYVEKDTIFSVPAALSDSDMADLKTSGEKGVSRTDVFVPRGSEVIIDMVGLHHNPRYWPDPYAFKPDRFLDPNWPRDAFAPFFIGPRSCMGRRFSEVEAIAIITLIIRKYKVSIDSTRFPDIPGESKLQRRERVLESAMSIVIRPCSPIPLIFTRR